MAGKRESDKLEFCQRVLSVSFNDILMSNRLCHLHFHCSHFRHFFNLYFHSLIYNQAAK